MKTAKEWAESVVVAADREVGRRLSRLQDPEDEELGAWLQQQPSWHAEAQAAGDASVIIERLVERVQADARAPLEEEIARLRMAKEDVEGAMRRLIRVRDERVVKLEQERDATLAEAERLREERRRDISAMDVLADSVSDNVWNELSETYPTLVDAVNALIQRVNFWRAEQM